MEFDFCSFNIRGIHNKIDFVHDFILSLRLNLFAVIETHVKEKDALVLSSKVNKNFDWLFNYQHHYNGRIWLGWNPMVWSVHHLFSSAQQLTCRVTRQSDNISFVLTIVYAHNDMTERRSLWNDLNMVNTSWVDIGLGCPWCITGDFNALLAMHESNTPPPSDFRKISEFRDCLNNIGVTDLQFSGDLFTWRDCNLDNPRMRKLDRVLVNDVWLASFTLSQATFLPRGLSDHNPAAVFLWFASGEDL